MSISNNPKKWGVRVYMHECDSVQHYIDIINNGSAYEEYRKLRDNGVEDSLLYVETLGAYASDKHYFGKIKSIIKKLMLKISCPHSAEGVPPISKSYLPPCIV